MATHSTFTQLSEEERRILFEASPPRKYTKGDEIVRQGALQGTMFVIVSGDVKVERHSEDGDRGERVVVDRLGPGQVFGEMSFLDREPCSATVIAESDVEVRGIGRKEIDDISRRDSSFQGRFFHCLALTLVDKLRQTSSRLS